MMWALRYHGKPELVLEKLPLPELGARSVRLRPIAVGLDGTDDHIVKGEFPVDFPVVTGHEVAGIVDAIGPAVQNIQVGDLVCIEPHEYCTKCRYCVTGREHLCLEKKAFGVHLNGGLAEALVVPERVVYKLPEGISPEIGCMAEPVSCCVHAMDRLEPVSGLGLLIFGAGAAGCILAKLSQLAGLSPIVVVEPQADRRELVKKFGADFVIDPRMDGWREEAMAQTNHFGYDFIIDAVGSGKVLESALSLTARGARVLVFGVAPPEEIAHFKPYQVFVKELTIIGTVINPYTHARAVELLPKLGLENLPIHTYSLDEHKEAFQQLGSGGKVIISPQRKWTLEREEVD